MQSIIQPFRDYLENVGYGAGTCGMLPACVSEFLAYAKVSPCGGDLEGADISYVEQQKVKSFLEYLQTRPLQKRIGALSEMMISHYVYALKTFFSWLEVTEQIDYNPISGMKFKRPKQNHREPLSTAEIKQLFAAADSLKQTALLHIFYSCGLRRSEGEALNISDVHFKNRLLYVREGKGAKRRVVPVTEKVSNDLEGYYLQERTSTTAQKVKDTEAFFLNKAGNRMSGDQLNKSLKKIIEEAQKASPCGGAPMAIGVEGASLHHLRHSIATHLLQSGMGMEYVRDFLGHGFLETTQLYAKPKYEQLKLL